MKSINFILLPTLLFSFLLTSCIKRANTDWTYEQDNTISSELYQDLYKQVDEVAQSNGDLKSCATVTFSARVGTFPNTATIDFGTGCSGRDGRTRTGKLEATFDGPWRDEGTKVTIRMVDYTVANVLNKYSVKGITKIENKGNTGVNNSLRYEVEVEDGEIADDANNVNFSWEGTTTYDLAEGFSTNFLTDGLDGITDDKYHVGGAISGVNRNGKEYTATIKEYLVRDLSCRWITQGIVELKPEEGDARTIDFGDGTCDADAKFTLGDFSFNFKLP